MDNSDSEVNAGSGIPQNTAISSLRQVGERLPKVVYAAPYIRNEMPVDGELGVRSEPVEGGAMPCMPGHTWRGLTTP